MDFLFDNPLANLYGPYFLVLYGLVIVWTIIGYRLVRRNLDSSERFGIPPVPHNPDAFEIAYLRSGENELARTVVFSLAQKNLLKFVNDDKTHQIQPTNIDFDRRALSPIENAALGWFNSVRDAKDLFQTGGLSEAVRPFAETYQNQLEMQHFIVDETMTKRNGSLLRRAFFIFAAVGAYKFIAAIYNGYWNVFGIVILSVVGMVALLIAGKMPRLTNLGKAYLERLQLAFERVKPSNHNPVAATSAFPTATFAAIDPFLLSVGVFGGAALAGTMYSDYNRTFEKAQNQSGSSCGSGCGSASSCSSGGGCSGGCGGGGCGGCGG